MYGFHKRVGLSDNSMKASERKNKSPSEYSNPYFRRGHPLLLWLINKPKSGNRPRRGKKEDGDADSEEEMGNEDAYGLAGAGAQPPRALPPASGEVGPLQKKDLQVVREQLNSLQQQQKTISTLITRLRGDHNQLYQQALMFQSMHDRHENSINAILNFLANVFRKSLEEQGGQQSVADLLAGIIPNAQMPQGSVVDLSELFGQQSPASSATMTPKRQQRLLPPIPNQGRASTIVGSPASTVSPAPYPSGLQAGQTGSVTELFDTPTDTTSPSYLKQDLLDTPQENMIKMIKDHNAGNSPAIDLPEMAANTPASMSNDQRNKMLSIMSGRASMASPSGSNAANPSHPAASMASGGPNMPAAAAAAAGRPSSLSPILPSMLPPSLHDISLTQDEIDTLQRMQRDQNVKIEGLSSLLGPLSPSGRIPGIDANGNPTQSYFGDNVDLDQYLDTDAYGGDMTFGAGDYGAGVGGGVVPDAGDFNFSLDNLYDTSAGMLQPGKVLETESNSSAPSPATTEDVPQTELGNSPIRNTKRRRVG